MFWVSVGSYFFSSAPICDSAGADLSARLGALTHDITVPYAGDKYVPEEKNRSAYEKARQILRKEHFLGTNRPATGTLDLATAYGNVLALGTSTIKVLPQIAELHGAALHDDKAGMQSIIGAIYANIGRTVPQGDAMRKLVDAARGAAIADGATNEEYTVKKPDYEIQDKYSPGSGKIRADVRGTDDKGEPFRTSFSGDLKGKPAPTGKDIELVAQPEDKPKIIDSVESKKLAGQISGQWTDADGKPWKIELQDDAITLTSIGINDHLVVYKGTYDLAQIRAEHKVDHPDDMLEDLPSPVKEELASSYHPPFNVDLEVSENADELKGTWTSLHVTYSGMTQSVSSIHDPWDKPLILTRTLSKIRILFTDRDFKPLDEVPVYVIPPNGPGGGEVWVEVQVPGDDKDFDDNKVENMTVHVTSDSDAKGTEVLCVETAAGSRIFRSKEAVNLYPVAVEVTP